MKKLSSTLCVFGLVIGIIVWLIVIFPSNRVIILYTDQPSYESETPKAALEVFAPACLSQFEQVSYQTGLFKNQKSENSWLRDDMSQDQYFNSRTQRIRLLCTILLSAL